MVQEMLSATYLKKDGGSPSSSGANDCLTNSIETIKKALEWAFERRDEVQKKNPVPATAS